MGIDENRLYSVAEAATIFNVARSTMERKIKETPIEHINLNSGRQYQAIRILGSTLIQFLENSIVTGERKPLYDVKVRESPHFGGLQSRC